MVIYKSLCTAANRDNMYLELRAGGLGSRIKQRLRPKTGEEAGSYVLCDFPREGFVVCVVDANLAHRCL